MGRDMRIGDLPSGPEPSISKWRSMPHQGGPIEEGRTNSAFFKKLFHSRESTEPQVVSQGS